MFYNDFLFLLKFKPWQRRQCRRDLVVFRTRALMEEYVPRVVAFVPLVTLVNIVKLSQVFILSFFNFTCLV